MCNEWLSFGTANLPLVNCGISQKAATYVKFGSTLLSIFELLTWILFTIWCFMGYLAAQISIPLIACVSMCGMFFWHFAVYSSLSGVVWGKFVSISSVSWILPQKWCIVTADHTLYDDSVPKRKWRIVLLNRMLPLLCCFRNQVTFEKLCCVCMHGCLPVSACAYDWVV